MRWVAARRRFLAACAGCLWLAQPSSVAQPSAERVTPVVRVFKECSPAVVNLSTTTIVTVRDPIFFGFRFDELFDMPSRLPARRVEQHSVGSGFLIHGDGFLITNAHVVDRTGECRVTLADGTDLPATRVAIDRTNDLAVLKIDAERPLPHLSLGRSDDLMQGETVIAIGNPLGLQHSVTSGIISALDRELRIGDRLAYKGLIQTDAAINPGHSGGPLLNVAGELIGINTAVRGDAQNIGFAIPVNRLNELLPAMLDIHRLRRVQFGIHFEADGAKAPETGVPIKKVDPGSPAAKAGVRAGDVLNAIEQIPTPDFLEAFSVLHRAKPGRTLALELTRGGGERRSVRVEYSETPIADAAKLAATQFGMTIREMTPVDLQRLSLRRPAGLYIARVNAGSPASKAGLEGGDILTLFAGYPVASLESLGVLLEQVERGDRIPVQILRIGPDEQMRGETLLQAE
jgi:serine protease Do